MDFNPEINRKSSSYGIKISKGICNQGICNSVDFVDINPSIHANLGKVTMLDKNSALIEEIGTDWCTIGHLQELTDEELNQVFTAVQAYANKLMTSVEYCK